MLILNYSITCTGFYWCKIIVLMGKLVKFETCGTRFWPFGFLKKWEMGGLGSKIVFWPCQLSEFLSNSLGKSGGGRTEGQRKRREEIKKWTMIHGSWERKLAIIPIADRLWHGWKWMPISFSAAMNHWVCNIMHLYINKSQCTIVWSCKHSFVQFSKTNAIGTL